MTFATAPRILLLVYLLLHSTSYASGQATTVDECSTEDQLACETSSNRTCVAVVAAAAAGAAAEPTCGYCIPGHLEYEGACYDIDDMSSTTDSYYSSMLEDILTAYLPDYVDQDNPKFPSVSSGGRMMRLIAAARVISYWNSMTPPPEFKLGFTRESLLTEEEFRGGRLGVNYNLTTTGGGGDGSSGRGEMPRFEYGGNVGVSVGGRGLEGSPPPAAPAVDWAADGYTTKVKNQGMCGCCWAVSTTASVESALMITNRTSRFDSMDTNSLSFQQLISCDDESGNSGCDGGNILAATRYIWENDNFGNGGFGGLVSYADWPYTDIQGSTSDECKVPTSGASPSAYLNYPQVVNAIDDRSTFEERRDRLMAAVSMQPVTSVLKSDCELLMNYKEGVLTTDAECRCCETSCIDHAVVIVGYNTTAPTPYWKLRNSWGMEWGEGGYFRIAMNEAGDCGTWGLFGMLAEQAMPSEAYGTLEELPDRPGWWETSSTAQKTLVIVASILGFLCLCGGLGALWRKCSRRRGSSPERPEDLEGAEY